MQAFNEHRYADATQQFIAALKTEAEGSAAYQESVLSLGESLYFQKKFADAIPWFEKAAGGSRPLVAAFMLGNACIQDRADEKALQAFASVYQVKPASAAAHLLLADMMLRAQMEPGADREARRALEIDPRIPQGHFILGEAALSRGDAIEAVKEFQKEIAIDPNFAMAYYRLGDAYGRRDAWGDAMAPLERAIWLNPNHSGPYVLLGKAYLTRQDPQNAESALRHALQRWTHAIRRPIPCSSRPFTAAAGKKRRPPPPRMPTSCAAAPNIWPGIWLPRSPCWRKRGRRLAWRVRQTSNYSTCSGTPTCSRAIFKREESRLPACSAYRRIPEPPICSPRRC